MLIMAKRRIPLMENKNDVILGDEVGLDLAHRSAQDLSIINLSGRPYLLVTFNNHRAQMYSLKKNGEEGDIGP